jgi:hypothetical protein
MHGLSAAELLGTWEQGQKQTFPQRALLLLTAGCPDIPLRLLAQLSIGQRDGYLLTLQELTFGQQLTCLVKCPECQDQLEFTLRTKEIRVGDNEFHEGKPKPIEIQSVSLADYDLEFRLPNSLDLIDLTNSEAGTFARQRLLERCLLKINHAEEHVPFDQLPPKVISAVIERMAQVDSQSEVHLALVCPTCAHQWLATFDIVSFLWSEVSMLAQRLLYEVHILAKAYGWSEADILALSPLRRQCYLGLAAR